MKKKIFYIICALAICASSFCLGLFIESKKQIDYENLEKSGIVYIPNIVDWNTDGNELSIMTENGYEWYAYKTENIYKNKQFIPVND